MSTGSTQSCFISWSSRASALIGSVTMRRSTRDRAGEVDELGDGAELRIAGR